MEELVCVLPCLWVHEPGVGVRSYGRLFPPSSAAGRLPPATVRGTSLPRPFNITNSDAIIYVG